MKIIGLIPALNEEKMIGNVVKKTLNFVDEVIVIDDGSNDNTRFEAEKAGATVIRNRTTQGLGHTMRRGYIEARKGGADIVVQLDADMQYDPGEIPSIIDPIINDTADLVLGSRLKNVMYDMPIMKRFGNRAFSWILRIITKQEVHDGQTGFRAIRGELLDSVLPTSKFSYTQEMILRAAFEGWRIKSVPVHFYQRYDEKSRLFKSTVGFAIRSWSIILKTLRNYYPLKFFSYPGMVFLISSGLLLCFNKINLGNINTLNNLTFLLFNTILITLGLILIVIGIYADMISDLKKEMK